MAMAILIGPFLYTRRLFLSEAISILSVTYETFALLRLESQGLDHAMRLVAGNSFQIH